MMIMFLMLFGLMDVFDFVSWFVILVDRLWEKKL